MEEKNMTVDFEVIVPDNESDNATEAVADEKDYILEVDGLKQYFPVKSEYGSSKSGLTAS